MCIRDRIQEEPVLIASFTKSFPWDAIPCLATNKEFFWTSLESSVMDEITHLSNAFVLIKGLIRGSLFIQII